MSKMIDQLTRRILGQGVERRAQLHLGAPTTSFAISRLARLA